TKRPHYLDELSSFDINDIENKYSNEELSWKLISSPTIASKKWVYEQYDSQVLTNTVSINGDAAIIRLKEIPGKAIALSTDCNERYVYLDAYQGGLAAVCEGARNVVCVGAEPIAITNCLNFGNPYDPEVYWQFKEAVRGIRDACIALNTPVTGGNVSFHNESQNNAIFPTPVIGMLGIIDNLDDRMSLEFKQNGDIIYLIGNNREELGGSEVIKIITGKILGTAPIINIEDEIALQKLTLDLIHNHIINATHDVAEGGIAIALAEMAIASKKYGCNVNLDKLSLGNLFGESQSRIIVTLPSQKITEFEKTCNKYNIPFFKLGNVIEDNFVINNLIKTTITNITEKWDNALENQLR
ncbi:MAG TPA: AIR synthase related protein, partial [Candidatus Kapabacteria bacterium]|nr:AIR synthase related protein [Candidatus Kapabacteria bacterium]